jgi:CRP-like cAMP-binding protein
VARKTRRNQVLAPQSKAKKLELKEPWPMRLMPESAVFQTRLGALPIATYEAGETVLSAGSSTGQLLILKTGKVSIVKENVEIAKVAEPGAVFGELSALLNQPHAADVCALEASQFHIAEAAALIGDDPAALLYIASVLARRLDSANQALIELKRQVQAGQSRSEIKQTIKKMEMALTPATASLVYAGYPYDPYA